MHGNIASLVDSTGVPLNKSGILGIVSAGGGVTKKAPDEIDDLYAWWDFSDASTITSSGSYISAITDKSSNSFTMSQSTSSDQPKVVTAGQGGLNTANFGDHTDSWMSATGMNQVSQPRSYYLVMKVPPSSAYKTFFRSGKTSSPDNPATMVQSTLQTDQSSEYSLYGLGSLTGVISGIAGTWQSMITIFNTTDSKWYVNGNEELSGNAGAGKSGSVNYIGVNADNNNLYSNTEYGEIAIFDSLISSDDLASLNAYAVDKWGL